MTSACHAIEAHQLGKRFGSKVVLAPMDLIVPRGSILALIGHNGAGKTTLIKALLNIIRPTSGQAKVLDMPSVSLRGYSFTRIAYVSENQELPEWMSVGQLMRHLRPLYPKWDDAGLLEKFMLPLDLKIEHCSRGMRMKVALASALAFQPEMVFMDEPFSGLDTAVRAELIETLLEHSTEHEMTVLISSHDLEEVETLATHVAFLHKGQLVFAEEMDDLLKRCREVTVTFPKEIVNEFLTRLPNGCVAAEASGAMLRFIDLRADLVDHEGAIRVLLPTAFQVKSEGMNLRSIFLALNKPSREADR
jgi:ABC-2 type transport system ATP-binding protein